MAATRPDRAVLKTSLRPMLHFLVLILLYVASVRSNDSTERPANCVDCSQLRRSNPEGGCATTPQNCGECLIRYKQVANNITCVAAIEAHFLPDGTRIRLDDDGIQTTSGSDLIPGSRQEQTILYAVIGVAVLACILILGLVALRRKRLDGRKRTRASRRGEDSEDGGEEGERSAKRLQQRTAGIFVQAAAGRHGESAIPLVQLHTRGRQERDSEFELEEPFAGPSSGLTAPPVDYVDTVEVHISAQELPYPRQNNHPNLFIDVIAGLRRTEVVSQMGRGRVAEEERFVSALPRSQAGDNSIPLGFEELDGSQAQEPRTEEGALARAPVHDFIAAQRFSYMAEDIVAEAGEIFHLEEEAEAGQFAGLAVRPLTPTEPMAVDVALAMEEILAEPEMDFADMDGDMEMDDDDAMASEDSGTETGDDSRAVPDIERNPAANVLLRDNSREHAVVPDQNTERIETLPGLLDYFLDSSEYDGPPDLGEGSYALDDSSYVGERSISLEESQVAPIEVLPGPLDVTIVDLTEVIPELRDAHADDQRVDLNSSGIDGGSGGQSDDSGTDTCDCQNTVDCFDPNGSSCS